MERTFKISAATAPPTPLRCTQQQQQQQQRRPRWEETTTTKPSSRRESPQTGPHRKVGALVTPNCRGKRGSLVTRSMLLKENSKALSGRVSSGSRTGATELSMASNHNNINYGWGLGCLIYDVRILIL